MTEQGTIERLREEDLGLFRDFCRAHWPGEHPLIHNEEMFNYYYRAADGGLNFFVARTGRELDSVCGFIPASAAPAPDIWISYILTRKGAPMGLGFRLLEAIVAHTNCRSVACNNVRKKIRGLYEFMGWQVRDMAQYYRANKEIPNSTICNIDPCNILVVNECSWEFTRIADVEELEDVNFGSFSENQPYKDRHYVEKRYFRNPWIAYEVYAGRDEAGRCRALLAVRTFRHGDAVALRVVDYIGDAADAARCGGFLDGLMRARGAAFIDWFALGLDDAVMARGGFSRRQDGDGAVVPFYLAPPVMENVTVTSMVSAPEGYLMFRADGDQDRPNLP